MALTDHVIAAGAVYAREVVEEMLRHVVVVIAEANEDARAVVPTTVQPVCEVQSTTTPPVKLISLAVMVRAQSDAAKAAMLATSS